MNWLRASLIAQGLLGICFQVFTWLPPSAWNKDPSVVIRLGIGATPWSIAIVTVFALLPPLSFALAQPKRLRSLMWLCVAHYAAWLAVEIKRWSSTRSLPDGIHSILLSLLTVVVVTSVIGLAHIERESHKPFPLWLFR